MCSTMAAANQDDQRDHDVQKALKLVGTAFSDILRCELGHYSFEVLYGAVYKIVLSPNAQRLRFCLSNVIYRHLVPSVQLLLAAAAEANDSFVREVLNQYDLACVGFRLIGTICLYDTLSPGRSTDGQMLDVIKVGTGLFRDHCVLNDNNMIAKRLQATLLVMVARQRNLEAVESCICKSACNMLMAFGSSAPANFDSDNKRFYYEKFFEQAFLENSEDVFRVEAQHLLELKSLPQFVDGVCRRQEQEKELCRSLHESSEKPLFKLLSRVMVETNIDQLLDSVSGSNEVENLEYLIDHEDFETLKRLRDLLEDSSEIGVESMMSAFRTAFETRAAVIVTKSEKSPELAEGLLKLYDCFGRVPGSFSSRIFDLDAGHESELREVFKATIEKEQNKCAESLAFYSDRLLLKSNKIMSYDDIKVALDSVASFFQLLGGEKDSYEGFYRQKLAKRLVTKTSVSEDLELHMIGLLTTDCGLEYTRKLRSMFTDLVKSRDWNEKYKQVLAAAPAQAELNSLDIYVEVLQPVNWPFRTLQQPQLAGAPQEAFDAFRAYYIAQHANRKLELSSVFGTAEITVTFYGRAEMSAPVKDGPNDNDDAVVVEPTAASSSSAKISPRNYTLIVNTAQMMVLSLFNSKPKWTFAEILVSTALHDDHCIRSLQALSLAKKQRVLLKRPLRANGQILPDDTFEINESFHSLQRRVKIVTLAPPKAERAKDDVRVREAVQSDRKYILDAALVRVMKSSQTMPYQQLISECITLVAERFKPDVLTMKQCIEDLINREFIRRDAADRTVLHYIA